MITLLVYVVLFAPAFTKDTSNAINGDKYEQQTNVCDRQIKETRSYRIQTVSHFEVSRRTSCKLFGWWRCNVKRTATRTKYVIKTTEVDVTVLYCCDGWQETMQSNGKYICDKPYCNIGCQNGGSCIGGEHKCSCKSGWEGDQCQSDIDECKKGNGGCDQACTNTPGSYTCGCYKGYVKGKGGKCEDMDECESGRDGCRCANEKSIDCGAKCINTLGGYKCSCEKGYSLLGNRVCQDVDECLSPSMNSCSFTCYNTPGSYACDCPRGFHMTKGGRTCTDINECATLNGGCQHTCLNSYGSYVCRCRLGYKLHHNRRRCMDYDECKEFHGCEMQCNNTFGSYFCSCPKGYSLDTDGFSCTDQDECALRSVKGLTGNISLSDCEQLCINTKGSFKCSCKRGFRLHSDGKTCQDTDECKSQTHKCEHKCTNTFGSYICSCRRGYKLNADQKTCRPLPCDSIETPSHGSMTCTGSSTTDTCQFKCDIGHQLLGSQQRTCLPESKWNGTKTICRAKSCPELQVPITVAVGLPCYKTFKSQCSLQCRDGYYSKTDDNVATCDVLNSDDMQWNVGNFKCEKIKVCDPSPCLNGGKCLINGRRFKCDCEGTGYEGVVCKTGVLTTPVFDKLRADVRSKTFDLYAQPKDELIVTIRSTKAIKVEPSNELRLSKSTKKVSFNIVPKEAGLHVISYTLSGEDQKHFKPPDSSSVYVKSRKSLENVHKELGIPENTLPVGCHDNSLSQDQFKCKAQLISSSSWVSQSSKGIVHLKYNNITLPISLFGAIARNINPKREEIQRDMDRLSSVAMTTSSLINNNGICRAHTIRNTHLLDLIQTDSFPNTMFSSLSSLIPQWIQFNVGKNNDLFDIANIIATVGKPLNSPGRCENILSSSTAKVFYTPSIAFQIHIDGQSKRFGSNEPACFAVDVCNRRAFLEFSSNARTSFHKMKLFERMRSAGWDFLITNFGLRTRKGSSLKSPDLWIRGSSKVYLNGNRLSVGVNMTGDTTANSKCFNELFTHQLSCAVSGEITGTVSLKAKLQRQHLKDFSLNIKSDKNAGRFTFGGGDHKCKSQGAHLVLKAQQNPFQESILSHNVLPYLQKAMNISIYHTIEGGGETGIKIPAELNMRLMILGFSSKTLQMSLKSAVTSLPKLKLELSDLLVMINKLDVLSTKASTSINTNMKKEFHGQEAQRLKKVLLSLNDLIPKILASLSVLSSKLSAYKSTFQAQSISVQIQSFKQNMQTVMPIKTDALRSAVKQNLEGLEIGTMAQFCFGQLCIPDVKVVINTSDSSHCPGNGDKNKQIPLSITVVPSKKVELGHILSIMKGNPSIFKLDSQELQLQAIVKLFDISEKAKVSITNQQLNAKFEGKMFKNFDCAFELKADTSKVNDWRSLVFKTKGRMDRRSKLTRLLEQSLNEYAFGLIKESERRVQKAKSGLQNATLETQRAESVLQSMQIFLQELENNRTSLKKKFKRKRVEYQYAIAWFDDALDQYNQTKSQQKRCTFTHCKKICNKTCVQDVCWDRVNATYPTADCSYIDSEITKMIPKQKSTVIHYTTTPTIRKDVGKCKSFGTAFVESFLTLGLYQGKRKKRSVGTAGEGERYNETFDINRFLRAANSSLPRDFDINKELSKRIPDLPNSFDLGKVLNDFVLKQHRFDVDTILKEAFPALSSNFSIDEELMKEIPELGKSFGFDKFLKNIVLDAVRSRTRIDFKRSLDKLFPGLASEFDKTLKRSIPQLKSVESITEVFQKHLGDVMIFSFNQTSLDKFDINDIMKKGIRGFPADFEMNNLLQNHVPNLRPDFDINNLIKNAILGIGPEEDKLDQLIAKAANISRFSLHMEISKTFPKFSKRFNIDELIKYKIQDMTTVAINKTRFEKLSFNQIIQSILPSMQVVNMDNVMLRSFPNIERQFRFREVLKDAIPLMKMLGDIDLNTLVTGNLIDAVELDLDKVLKKRNPAFKGNINVERFLSKRLKDVSSPDLDSIIHDAISTKRVLGVNGVIEDIIGGNAVDLLNHLVKNSVFSEPDTEDIATDVDEERQTTKRPRLKRSFENPVGLQIPGNQEGLGVLNGLEGVIGNIGNLKNLGLHKGLEGLGNFIGLKDLGDVFKNPISGVKNIVSKVGSVFNHAQSPVNRVAAGLAGGALGFLGANLLGSFKDAAKNSGCSNIYVESKGPEEILSYKQLRATSTSQNIAIKKWVCKNWRNKTIQANGFKPRQCCRKDIPCVTFLDPLCVINNTNCLNERLQEFKRDQSLFNVSLHDQYWLLLAREEEVNEVALQLEENRLLKEVALQNIDIVTARVGQLEALENKSRLIYEMAKSIPQVDRGFKVKRIVQDSFTDRPLRITSLSFNTLSATLRKSRLPFQANIKRKRGIDLVLDFVIDFRKLNSSISYATQEAIRLLTSQKRKKRSLDSPKNSEIKNREYEKCLMANNASLFFSDILESMSLMITSKDEQMQKVSKEDNELDNVVHALGKGAKESNGSTTKGYIHVLTTYRNERQQQSKMLSWNETLVNWKNYIENMTEVRRLPDCSGSVDCVEELNKRLSELYKGLGNSTNIRDMVSKMNELTSGIIALLTDNIPEDEIKTTLQGLSILADKTKDVNLLCGSKPEMLSRSNDEIKVLVGERVTLHCNASSSTEIKYSWRKDNAVIQKANGYTLALDNVQVTDEGLYGCDARNHIGHVSSGITTISVEAKPRILEHPIAVQAHLNTETAVQFTCAASGRPLPTITWLYRPPASSYSVVLHGENSNILSVTPDNVNKGGHYYCEVKNTRGLVISREARLDILPVTTANPKIAFVFNVTSHCRPSCPAEQALPARMDTSLRNSVITMISKSLSIQTKDVTRPRYWRKSKSIAQIFLYASSRISNSKNMTGTVTSMNSMMKTFSETRINLSGNLKRLVHAINKTVLSTQTASIRLAGIAETLAFFHIQSDCPIGQWLHNSGYFCVHCPPGSYKEGLQGGCLWCPTGTYQPLTGQSRCISCSLHKTTLGRGTIESTDCFNKAICKPGSFASRIDKCEKCPLKTYQPLAGQTSCIPCTTGSELGQTHCRKGPRGSPRNLIASAITSTSINLQWLTPKDSIVSYYEVEYVDSAHELPMVKINVQLINQSQADFKYKLHGLEAYTEYILKVYVVSGKERGKPATVTFRTMEDVPAKAPRILSAVVLNSTAIEVHWEHLPLRARNGIIISYNLYIKESSFSKYIKKQVGPELTSTIITDLNHHTIYCIRMSATTSKGESWKNNRCVWVKTKL